MQRTIFHLPGLTAARDALERDFAAQVAARFTMDFGLTAASTPKRVAIMVSKDDHCLLDLLWRNRRGELDMSVVVVISNHPDLADQARSFGVPFLHVPATKDIRARAEQRQLDALRGNVDLVVLARYMQIITAEFLAQVGCPLINIHHSFLPSFVGAAPYRRAKERGVKLIGATAHYVTEHLDDGPIIEQDVVRVDHRHHVADLTRLGADAERAVLSRAVRWHCEDRIIRHATPPTPTRVDATPAIGMGRRTGIGVPGYRSPMGPRTRNCQRCRQSFGQRRVSNVASGGTLRFGRRPFCWPAAA